MTTSNPPPKSSPSKRAAKARPPIPETMYGRVKRLDEYHTWVSNGGLEECVKRHNVDVNFVDDLFLATPKVQVAYDAELRTMPTLLRELNTSYKPEYTPCLSELGRMAMMDYEDSLGWEEELSDENPGVDEEGKKESRADIGSTLCSTTTSVVL